MGTKQSGKFVSSSISFVFKLKKQQQKKTKEKFSYTIFVERFN